MAANPRRQLKLYDHQETPVKVVGFDNDHGMKSKGEPLKSIIGPYSHAPHMKDMAQIPGGGFTFMISNFRYDPTLPLYEPKKHNLKNNYIDPWDEKNVLMPSSIGNKYKDNKLVWSNIADSLFALRKKCEHGRATVEHLKATINECVGHPCDTQSLENLLNTTYSRSERNRFLTTVLPKICTLAMDVDKICGQAPPVLRARMSRSLTMSKEQAASLLACAFFSLFPHRSEDTVIKEFREFQNPNFLKLYEKGPPEKIEKLKCILHYFNRITEQMPTGVISFYRFVTPATSYPDWARSKTPLTKMHITSSYKIEDITYALQVDFADKYIGGDIFGSRCAQEEIRFSICPEMLISLLLFERMEDNECIYMVGCEQFCSYKGYGSSFQFVEDFQDKLPVDNWGRKWCHVVAMDSTYFKDPKEQYDMKHVNRELIKVYTSFCSRSEALGNFQRCGIITGNWGCGGFNGDKQLKALIQWIAASEAGRPLIYAAYLDRKLVATLFPIYEYLIHEHATVGDLYRYLETYSQRYHIETLFEYIIKTPIKVVRPR